MNNITRSVVIGLVAILPALSQTKALAENDAALLLSYDSQRALAVVQYQSLLEKVSIIEQQLKALAQQAEQPFIQKSNRLITDVCIRAFGMTEADVQSGKCQVDTAAGQIRKVDAKPSPPAK